MTILLHEHPYPQIVPLYSKIIRARNKLNTVFSLSGIIIIDLRSRSKGVCLVLV